MSVSATTTSAHFAKFNLKKEKVVGLANIVNKFYIVKA